MKMNDSLVCLCKYDDVIFAQLLMQIWRMKAWTHMPVLMVFKTIIELLCVSLEITSCIYVYFVLWHVNIYNDVMFGMFYVICLCAVCDTNFDAPSVHIGIPRILRY
jgi:hypothetical protein